MRHRWLAPVLLALLPVAACAQSDAAKRVLARYAELRPQDPALAMYRLDWAVSYDAARARASKERKPLLLVVIHAKYGDMITGHC